MPKTGGSMCPPVPRPPHSSVSPAFTLMMHSDTLYGSTEQIPQSHLPRAARWLAYSAGATTVVRRAAWRDSLGAARC